MLFCCLVSLLQDVDVIMFDFNLNQNTRVLNLLRIKFQRQTMIIVSAEQYRSQCPFLGGRKLLTTLSSVCFKWEIVQNLVNLCISDT